MSFLHSNSIQKQDHDHSTFIWQWDVPELLFTGMLALPFVLIWFVPPENLGAFYLTAVINNIGLSILAFCFAVDLRRAREKDKISEKAQGF